MILYVGWLKCTLICPGLTVRQFCLLESGLDDIMSRDSIMLISEITDASDVEIVPTLDIRLLLTF